MKEMVSSITNEKSPYLWKLVNEICLFISIDNEYIWLQH